MSDNKPDDSFRYDASGGVWSDAEKRRRRPKLTSGERIEELEWDMAHGK